MEKANVFASHLEKVFQPSEITTDINPAPTEIDGPTIKNFTPKEIKFAIDKLNPRKAPGIDSITVPILQEIPKEALVMLTYMFNSILRLRYFPKLWKIAR